jgi:L-malate glycosyltransferase
MRILFANHTSAWSGAEVSLMRVVQVLRGHHDVSVACPSDGPLAEAVELAGIQRLPMPAVEASLRVHPLRTAAGLGQFGAGGVALARAAKRFRADVIHANTLRAGLIGAVALRLGSPPVVVRAHEHLPLTPLGRAARSVMVRTASAVVAVSDYTARWFNDGLAHPVATRVYNSIDHARFDPQHVGPAGLRDELGLAAEAPLLGQVAQITPWKCQDTSIRALAELRRGGLNAHLLIVGGIAFRGRGVRHDNHGFLRALHRLVDELAVRGAVHFLGQRGDVPEIMRELDLSLLPSWGEPFGLVTVESMALGTPPLVSARGAGPELVEDGVSGRVLAPKRPEAWAVAASELLEDPQALRRLGERGPVAAARFRDDVHAREMLAIYERAAGAPVRGAPSWTPGAIAAPVEERAEEPWPS